MAKCRFASRNGVSHIRQFTFSKVSQPAVVIGIPFFNPMATSKTLSQLRLLWTRRLRVRPRMHVMTPQHRQQHMPMRWSCAAMRRRCFLSASSTSDFEASASLLQRVIADEKEGDAAIGDSAISSGDGRITNSTSSSSNNSSSGAGVFSMTSTREGGEFAVDTLPALKVLSETFALVKKSPAFQNWSSTDWLFGLTGMHVWLRNECCDAD